MIVSIENKCLHCSKVFCCPDCRLSHELKTHVCTTSKTFQTCALCLGKKLQLQIVHTTELLHHIAATHLPLHCNKCQKIFSDVADFGSITACKKMCDLQSNNAFPKNYGKVLTDCEASLQNASKTGDGNASAALSPAALGYEGSLSSIRINTPPQDHTAPTKHYLQQTKSPKQKLVRQTSTPMHAANGDLHRNRPNCIHRPHSFDSITSSCQMSTISSSYSSESDISLHVSQNIKNPSPAYASYKTSARIRAKFPAGATPLRQVMSRSIQKAIVEHGLPNFLTASHLKYSPTVGSKSMSFRSPLDLRTSPAIRRDAAEQKELSNSSSVRSQSRNAEDTWCNAQRNKKLTFGSSSECSLDTVYETCKSFEELPPQASTHADTTTSAAVSVSAELYIETEVFQTPKSTGALKKTASFADNINACNEDDEIDEWFTPLPLHRRYTCTEIQDTKYSNVDGGAEDLVDDEVFEKSPNPDNKRYDENNVTGISIWSLVSSVLRLASFGKAKASTKENHQFENDHSQGHSIGNKRRRTNTVNCPIQTDIKRPRRIHGRPPLERMRKISDM